MSDAPEKSIKKSSWKWRSRYCAWAGVVALSFQVAVSLGQGLAVSRAGGDSEASVYLVICDIFSGNTRAPLKGGDPVSYYPSCPVCVVNTLGFNIATVDYDNTFQTASWEIIQRSQIIDQPVAVKAKNTGYPRAPPFTV